MDNQFDLDRQIIEEFFQKCVDANAGNDPEKSAEIEKIEKYLKDVDTELFSLKKKIQDDNSNLQSLTFHKYYEIKIQDFLNKNPIGKKLKRALKNNASWLLLIFAISTLALARYIIFVVLVLLLVITFLFLILLDKFKSKQYKLKQVIQLGIEKQHSLESEQKSLKRDKSIKEKEYVEYRKNEEQKMLRLEEQVEKILQFDKKLVLQESAQALNFEWLSPLRNSELVATNYSAEIQQRPIIFCTGISNPSRKARKIFSRGRSVVTNRDLAEVEKLYEEPLVEVKFPIPPEGLRNPFSGRAGYYQFYSFEIILLGSDYLCYYSCLRDFYRRGSVDVTTVEYFYDSIASIKTMERSSLRQKSSVKKRIYWDILSISTFDGTVLYIRQEKDRSGTEKKESELNKATREIRQWLRRRKEQTYNKQSQQ